MLISLKEMLAKAREEQFAVGAFNTTDLNLVRAVIEEAEATQSPAILQFAPGEFNFATPEFFAYVTLRMRNSDVPFALHLDHGKTAEDCLRAIQAGFTSVMIDGSQLPFEENMRLTRQVAELAHACGVSVEGEIGTIGAMSTSDEGGVENITYTNPEDVVKFVEGTGVDALAIAIGTAHGLYPKGFVPKLQLELLKQIHQVAPVPLVLHGGTHKPDEEIRQACAIGIQKVNISSDIKQTFFRTLQATLDETHGFLPPKMYGPAIAQTRSTVHAKMELFGSLGKASFY